MKKIFLFILSALVVWVGVSAIFHVTEGFFPWNIRSHVSIDSRWDMPPLSEEKEKQLNEIFNQKFYYLAKGHQAYVFVSEDDKWVVKFPKFQRYRLNPLLEILPLPGFLAKSRERKRKHKFKEVAWILDSWKIAYEELPEMASLIYVQINPCHQLKGELTLIDKIGFEHQITLSNATLLVQRKAEVFDHYIKRHCKAKDYEPAKKAIKDLVALAKTEYAMGFVEHDQHIDRNMGYSQGKMIHIDPARFIKVPPTSEEGYLKKQVLFKTERLRIWLKIRYPELVDTLDKEIAKLEL